MPLIPVVGIVALATWILLFWVDAGPTGNLHTGDTNNLVAGARYALDCVGAGEFVGCGKVAGTNDSAVGPYALLQYLPAAFFIKVFAASDDTVVRLLGHLSTVTFIITCAVAALPFRRNRRLWPIVIVAIAFSSAAYQATSGFGEMLAAASVLFAVVAAMERRLLLLGPLCFLATLSKDTIPPFLLMLVLIAAYEEGAGWRPDRRVLVTTVVSIGAGVMTMVAFNVFRFDTLANRFYLSSDFRTPGLARKAEWVIGLWASPSAGIIAFWPIASVLLAVGVVAAARRWRRRTPGRHWLPLALALLTGAVFVAGLSSWFSPFGWIAYGPRLAVPILPALVVTVCRRGEPEITACLGWIARRSLVRVAAILVVCAAALPQATAPWGWFGTVRALMAADDTCPALYETSVLTDRDQYFECFGHYMWRVRPNGLWAAVKERDGLGNLGQVAGVLAAAALTAGALSAGRPGADDRRVAATPRSGSTSSALANG